MHEVAAAKPIDSIFDLKRLAMKTALVADAIGTGKLFQKALGSHFSITRCLTLKEAKAALLRQEFDVILCEVSFDTYHAIPLLNYAKRDPANHDIPFILVNAKDNPGFLVQSDIDFAKKHGARAFINAYDWQETANEDMAASNLRMYISSLIRFSPTQFWKIGEVDVGYRHYRV